MAGRGRPKKEDSEDKAEGGSASNSRRGRITVDSWLWQWMDAKVVQTPEELVERSKAYFDHCEEIEQLPKIPGLWIVLGTSPRNPLDTWSDKENPKHNVMRDTYKKIRATIEAATLARAENNEVGSIFMAKAAFDYRDNSPLIDAQAGGSQIVINIGIPSIVGQPGTIERQRADVIEPAKLSITTVKDSEPS